MTADIQKKILELADVQHIQPDFDRVKILSRETCEKIQAIIFGGAKRKITILTTNNFPTELEQLLRRLAEK